MPVESKGSLKDIVYAKQYNPFNKGRLDVACWKWIYIMTVMPPSSGERWDLVMLEKTKDLSIIRHKHLHFLISPHCKFRQLPKICEVWIRNLGGMILSGQQCEDWKPTESIERVSLGPEFLAHPWFSLVSIKFFICLVDFNSTTCSPHLPAPRPSPPGPFLRRCHFMFVEHLRSSDMTTSDSHIFTLNFSMFSPFQVPYLHLYSGLHASGTFH